MGKTRRNRKSISEALHEVDPNLKIIEGGIRYRRSASKEWHSAKGVICLECEQETLRIIDGLCPQCYRNREAERERKLEDRTERRYYKEQLRRGTVSLAQMREGRLP